MVSASTSCETHAPLATNASAAATCAASSRISRRTSTLVSTARMLPSHVGSNARLDVVGFAPFRPGGTEHCCVYIRRRALPIAPDDERAVAPLPDQHRTRTDTELPPHLRRHRNLPLRRAKLAGSAACRSRSESALPLLLPLRRTLRPGERARHRHTRRLPGLTRSHVDHPQAARGVVLRSHGRRARRPDVAAAARDELQRQFGPDGYNIGLNNGIAAGQTVMHVHMHLIPRYAGDRGTRAAACAGYSRRRPRTGTAADGSSRQSRLSAPTSCLGMVRIRAPPATSRPGPSTPPPSRAPSPRAPRHPGRTA